MRIALKFSRLFVRTFVISNVLYSFDYRFNRSLVAIGLYRAQILRNSTYIRMPLEYVIVYCLTNVIHAIIGLLSRCVRWICLGGDREIIKYVHDSSIFILFDLFFFFFENFRKITLNLRNSAENS